MSPLGARLAAGLLLVAGFALAPQPRAAEPLDRHFDGFYLDDAPEAPRLLQRRWWRTAERAAGYLARHPRAQEIDLAAIVAGVGEVVWRNTLRLDARTFLVAPQYGESGSVFALGPDGGGRVRILWSLAEAKRLDPRLPELVAAWMPERARGSCRERRKGEGLLGCGPLIPEISLLPPAADGSARFYLRGTYAQKMGATVFAQYTIWRWRGGGAELLYHTLGDYMIDQSEDDRLEGDLLRLRQKGEFKSFFSCGSCEGRQFDHVLRIESDRIVDLGEESAVPELDLADELLARAVAGAPLGDLADPGAALWITEDVARLKAAGEIWDGASFGMIFGSDVVGAGEGRKLCLGTDVASYLFTLRREQGRDRIAAAAALKEGDCD